MPYLELFTRSYDIPAGCIMKPCGNVCDNCTAIPLFAVDVFVVVVDVICELGVGVLDCLWKLGCNGCVWTWGWPDKLPVMGCWDWMRDGSPLALLDMVNNGFIFPLLPSSPIICNIYGCWHSLVQFPFQERQLSQNDFCPLPKRDRL